MDGRDLRIVGALGNAGDQVKRRKAFEAAHPEWRIAWDESRYVWRATRCVPGATDEHVRFYLVDLLDALEKQG